MSLMLFFSKYFLISLITIISILLVISFFTLVERKILAGIQRRHGPVFTGSFGILQPFADGLKLILKEVSIPSGGYYYVFLGSSILSLVLSLSTWTVIPFNSKLVIADINFGILFILFISSLNVYATLFSGWSSNSKYGLLGSIRSGAQMISYELPMTLSIVPIVLFVSSFNLTNIVNFQANSFWFIFFIPSAYIFFVTMLAETNRTPFDLPEAESELVAGYNIEYSSLPFAFFFLAEYNHMLVMSFFFSILFLGGWSTTPLAFCITLIDSWMPLLFEYIIPVEISIPVYDFYYSIIWWLQQNRSLIWETSVLTIKAIFVVFLFISIRAVAPRYKYVQLIKMCWSIFIPVLLFYIMVVIAGYERALIWEKSIINEIKEYPNCPQGLAKTSDNTWSDIYVNRSEYRYYGVSMSEENLNHEFIYVYQIPELFGDKEFMEYARVWMGFKSATVDELYAIEIGDWIGIYHDFVTFKATGISSVVEGLFKTDNNTWEQVFSKLQQYYFYYDLPKWESSLEQEFIYTYQIHDLFVDKEFMEFSKTWLGYSDKSSFMVDVRGDRISNYDWICIYHDYVEFKATGNNSFSNN